MAAADLPCKDMAPVRPELLNWRSIQYFTFPRDDPRRNLPHFVYRVYDINDELLYVGCSMNVKKRIAAHKRRPAAWAERMATVDVTEYPNWAEGRAAERRAIADEQPEYNVKLNPARLRAS